VENYNVNKTDVGWERVKEGARRASKTASTKVEIVKLAVEFLADKTASVKIHRQDGVMEEERTYPRSADPTRSRG